MVRHRKHQKQNGFMNIVHKSITPATGVLSFVGQVTSKDVAAYPTYQQLSNTEKLKFLGNSIASRVTGFSPYPQYGTPGFTINPTGPINKYTGLGIGLAILGEVAPRGYGKADIKRAAKGFVIGGILGGLFDPPAKKAGQTQSQQQLYTNAVGAASLNTSTTRGAI